MRCTLVVNLHEFRSPDFVADGPDREDKKGPDLTWINSPTATCFSPSTGCYIVVLRRLLWQAGSVEFMECNAPAFGARKSQPARSRHEQTCRSSRRQRRQDHGSRQHDRGPGPGENAARIQGGG